MAVNGYSIHLPGDITTGEQLFQIIQAKQQLRRDMVAGKRYPASMVDLSEHVTNPWMLKAQYANLFTEEEVESYDCHFFRVTQKLARHMDIRQVGILQSVWQALEDAGITGERIYRTRTGVFASGYVQIENADEAPDEATLRGKLMSSLSDHVAFYLGTHGPSVTLETACSSSLVALSMAVAALRKGDCDFAIVACVNIPQDKDFHLSLQACGVLSATGTSHPFEDQGPKGYVRAEGYGCIVLRRFKDAVLDGDRILCTIRNAVAGSAGAVEGMAEGAGRMYESPCVWGMKQLMTRAYEGVHLSPASVSYMECHATGTYVGDVLELQAIGEVLGLARTAADEHATLRVASVKSNIGHAECSAGMFSLAKVIEMLRRRVFLPTAGVTTPRTDFDWEGHRMRVIQEVEPFGPVESTAPMLMGVNSFGIGGSYAHVIVEEYRPPTALVKKIQARPAFAGPLLFPLSAVSAAHLKMYARELVTHLTIAGAQTDLRDVCGTMAVNRTAFQYRKALVGAQSLSQLVQQLEGVAAGPDVKVPDNKRGERILFVFTGQGSQWVGCGETLMQVPVYRERVLHVDGLFQALSGWSILEKSRTLTAEELRETQYAQPVTFLIQMGLLELLASFGVLPSIVVGHSAGEVGSAYAAGLLSLEEAVQVVYYRSAEQQTLAGCGRLLAVGLGQNEVLDFLAAQGLNHDVEIACVNSPSGTVLAGLQETLDKVKAALPEGTFSSFVQGNIAFHSSHVEPILPEIRRRLAFLNEPNRPPRDAYAPVFVSTVSGEEAQRTDARYWCENVRSAVVFEHAVHHIFGDENTAPDLVLEIGPHKTLAGPLLQTIRGMGREALVLPTLKRNAPCLQEMMGLLGALFEEGVKLELLPFFDALEYQFVDLPKHPFIKTRMHELIHVHLREKVSGLYLQGPVAGSFKCGAYEVEVCDRTFKPMMDHKMGGQEILPGCFYVEMAIEAVGLPCTLTNVEFKSMCKIPKTSANQTTTLVSLGLKEVEGTSGEVQSFVVRSTPAKVRVQDLDEPLAYTDHCNGFAVKGGHLQLTDSGDLDPSHLLQPAAFGYFAPLQLKDIGKDGILALQKHHTHCLAKNKEHVYGIINQEGLAEYGPSFQVVTSFHGNMVDDTYLGVVEFDSKAWGRRGGNFGVQLLDALYQILFLLPSHNPQIVMYAGGFESAHFVRKPTTNKLFVFLDHDSNLAYVGRKKGGGDVIVYDEEGRLLLFMKGISCIAGASTDTTCLSDLAWQSRIATPDAIFAKEFVSAAGKTSSVDALAQVVVRSAQAFHQAHGGKSTVVRILEIVEDAAIPTLAEALSTLVLDSNQILEVFIGSHNIQVLNMVAGAMGRTGKGLRVRKIVLSALPRELADYAFDVVAFHAWHASGQAAWAKGEGPDPVVNALTAIKSFVTPGAQLLALGLEGEEEQKAWTTHLQPLASDVVAAKGGKLVVGRMVPSVPVGPRTFLIVAEDLTLGTQLERHLASLAGPQCRGVVLTCGAHPKAHFQDSAKAAAWGTTLDKALKDLSSAKGEVGFQGIVFLGGLGDDTVLGTTAFGRLAKLCQAATACEQQIAALVGGEREGHLWVLTEGAYGGTIRPNQGTMQGFTFVIAHELPALEARLIDMATDTTTTTRAQALAKAAEVLAYTPREKVYLVARDAVQVPRYFPLDIAERRSQFVSPTTTELAYCCDVSMELSTPGQINVLFQTLVVPPPGEGQVTVDIHAAALNFRDVLIAINMLPELSFEGSYYGRHLGMEAAGIVSAVGPGVTHLQVGDRVATAEASCFGNRLNAPAKRVVKLLDSIRLEVAASTQSVYNTAHHALINIAHIKKGDRVLVHAAAGGVGQAAISVCKHVGAVVYATASAGKRDAVRALGVEHIYDSRSTSWFADVMRDTENRGVDVVLNSLAGKHQQLGVQVLAPGGRFCEIGKLDLYDNAKLGLLALRKNALFTAIDMDRLALDDPELTIRTTAEVFDLLGRGLYHEIPATVFPMDQIHKAIELIKAGKHTGKVVLSNFTAQGAPVPVRVLMPQTVFHPGATYLVTGGAGGFGSKIVRRAFDKGARHFVITVTKDPERVTALFGDLIKLPGCTVDVVVADTASEKDMADLVKYASAPGRPPLKAVFHVAGVSMDTVLTDVKAADLLKVGGCKALGALYLHEHTKDLGLETFCVISSVASLMGGRGRSAYSSANAFMDALMRHRHSLGLPGTAFNMTSLSDVGILANDIKVRQMQLRSNVEFVRSQRALEDLEDAIMCRLPLGCELFFRENAVGVYPNRASFLHGGTKQFTLGADAATAGDRALTAKEIQTLIADTIKAIAGHKEVVGSSALFSVGMDSFSTVELISRIKQMFGVEINPSKIGPATTVADVTKMVHATQSGSKGAAAAPQPAERKKEAAAAVGPAKEKPDGSVPGPAVESGEPLPTLKAIKGVSALPGKKAKVPATRRAKEVVEEMERATQRLDQKGVEMTAASRRAAGASAFQANQKAAAEEADKTVHQYGKGKEGEIVHVPVGCFGFWKKPVPIPAVSIETTQKWLHVAWPTPLAKARLVCLPWAGGTSSLYNYWQLQDVEIVTVVMPGRDTRTDEKTIGDIYLTAEAIVKAIHLAGYLEEDAVPLSVFGHSFGSYVGLEVARLLKLRYRYDLDQLFVGSAFPPHRRSPIWWYSCGPHLLVMAILGYLGGLPDDYRFSASNHQATKLCAKDLSAMDFYHMPPDKYLECPLHVLYGDKDVMTPHTSALGWGDFTSKAMSLKHVGRGHLFTLEKESMPGLLTYLQDTLTRVKAPLPLAMQQKLAAAGGNVSNES